MIQNALQELIRLTWIKAGKEDNLLYAKSGSDLKGLPSSLKELYSFADGQKEELVPIFEMYRFLRSKEAFEFKRSMDEVALEEGWYEDHWWEKTWFPFAEDGAGQFLVVDKNSGNVLEFNHDDPKRPILAESLEAYINSLVVGLKSGELTYDVEIGICSTEDLERYRKERKSWVHSRRLLRYYNLFDGLFRGSRLNPIS
ncbi:SMI1/KNR4 family protein [Leptospira yasudae]|uniref:SMI1/KNR4 family protein n=1 Tax=Leptospira yasudae TaxID=2202201 RepID=A0A6N4R2U9_9LEPT|nr:SMI1/KNR4 family protein [Leptospira yasudae]TGL76640.1 SMI1/KNR4 family protein [Leptospira yasudae]TGL83570.1 SMI1/KNR4 family protein [Leptospira yasudae]TGL88010.1 SMI1/KNR4 family protein [Leptospira yasudae]